MENDAKGIIHGYREQYWKAPVLRKWEPREFELRYYNTPKKLERERAKRDAEYQKEFEKANAKYEAFCEKCDKITGLQAENLRDFFVESIQRNVEEAQSRRDAAKAKMRMFRDEYDKVFKVSYSDGVEFEVNPFEKAFDIVCHNFESKDRYRMLPDEVTIKVLPDGDYYRRVLNAFCPTDEEKMRFVMGYLAYRKNRVLLEDDSHSPSTVFVRMVEQIAEIVESIRKVLGGEPEGCSFDVDWGVGGHFNGIVERAGKRASFKSFFAGGWNIQRLHIRFRVTPLKG